MINLLPIPVALVRIVDGELEFLSVNSAYITAGLGQCPRGSPLAQQLTPEISDFVAGTMLCREFPWQFGNSVDCRYFTVTLSRLSSQSDGRCLIALIDQTSELRTEQNLRREMMTDSLTGLPNRAGFSDLLETAMGHDDGGRHRFAVMIVDLDRFSRVNACLGSMAGDELLITFARRLKGALRARDVLARTGGDEFGILLTLDGGRIDADHVAKRIQSALATPFVLSDFEIRVTASIGIAFGTDALEESEDLIRQAQFAVKRSKSSGIAEAYQGHAFDAAREQFGIETALRRALDRGDLRLAYHPICDLSSGRVTSFEALARWRTEDGTEISPNEFIPVAEESGLIVPLGRWALLEAARTLAGWDALAGGNCGVRVAVNVSAIQLQRDHIVPAVEHALQVSGLKGERLTLELTESALVTDPDRIARTMRSLKALGTTIAMDDFGTGYSNLAYLQQLPIDVLKIDRRFVTAMLADRDKLAIVRAILSLAQALSMKTTAEGIETNELSQTLSALGCTYGQGFLYARPLEAEAAFAYLSARRN